MKITISLILIALGVSGFLVIIQGMRDAHNSQAYADYVINLKVLTEECELREGRRNDYLAKACVHVIQNKIPVTTHPSEWWVLGLSENRINGESSIVVEFSCCGAGDVGYFNAETGKLLAYVRKPWRP